MTVDPKLLEILVCPLTKQPLNLLSGDNLNQLNASIRTGEIHSADGKVITQPLSEALITRNRTLIYRIEDGIPIMLEDQAIHWDNH